MSTLIWMTLGRGIYATTDHTGRRWKVVHNRRVAGHRWQIWDGEKYVGEPIATLRKAKQLVEALSGEPR